MGFIENLAKGFVRSAVNQVGRDTGKVVSNKIYGNAHASPIKGIKQEEGVFYDEIDNIMTDKEVFDKIKNEGYKIDYFMYNPFFKTFYWLFGLGVTAFVNYEWGKYYALIPPLLVVFLSYLKFADSKVIMRIYQMRDIATYKSDRRYKNGVRITGFSKGKITFNMPPTKTFILKNLIVSFVYAILAIYMYFLTLYLASVEDVTWEHISINTVIVFIIFIITHIYIKNANLAKPK